MATMQAIRLERETPSSIPVVRIGRVPKPQADENHVVVQIKASAIQPSDRLNAKGGFAHTTLPRTPGRDFAGVVVDGPSEMLNHEVFGTGGGLLGFEMDGAHAEFCLIHKSLIGEKPSNMSFVEASAVGVPFTTAFLCLRRARVTPRDSVLVIGSSGAVGSAALQISRALGCQRVFGAARRESAEVNITTDRSFGSLETLTEGKGVDVIVDTVGDLELMDAAAKYLAPRGRFTWIAAPRGTTTPPILGINILTTYRKDLEFIGCNSGGQTPSEVGDSLQKLSKMFGDGSIQFRDGKSLQKISLNAAVDSYQTEKNLQVIVLGD